MSAEDQTEKLASYIQKHYSEEIKEGLGAADVAINIINKQHKELARRVEQNINLKERLTELEDE